MQIAVIEEQKQEEEAAAAKSDDESKLSEDEATQTEGSNAKPDVNEVKEEEEAQVLSLLQFLIREVLGVLNLFLLPAA